MSRIIDISQTLRPSTPVWPGDTPFDFQENWQIDDTCPVMVSKLTMSTHSGSHADAPCHYDKDAKDIAEVSLRPYIGRCFVFNVTNETGKVCWSEIEEQAAQITKPLERVILRTYTTFPHHNWVSNFRAVEPRLITELAGRGCLLIGTDAPSLDPETSKEILAHHAVKDARMAILEGLVLDDVAPGEYELIAPPLKIEKADASPVRALLKEV